MARTVWAAALVLAAAASAAGGEDYADYDRLLERYVDEEGLVAYAEWKADDEAALRAVVARLAGLDPGAMTPAERKAYWINAYNAVTLQAMLEFYPLASIKDKVSDDWSVWKDYLFAGRSLDQIEHELLRPLGDPRIHAAIVCASIGCPPLRDEAYTAERLEAQLDDQVRTWLADPERGLRVAGDGVHLSQVFEWFGTDFAADLPGRLRWIARYVEGEELAARLRGGKVRVRSLDWDWALNAQP